MDDEKHVRGDDELREGAIVIPIGARRTATLRLIKKPWSVRGCLHDTIIVDEAEQSTTCEKCHKRFEPFEALVHITEDIGRYMESEKSLARECERLERARDSLQREIKNLKAQKRRETKP